jgi:hypothetical protein
MFFCPAICLHLKSVGAVWQNAHEWIRLNLQKIVSYYLAVENIDLAKYLGLTAVCYDRGEIITAGTCSWEEEFEGLGTMRHAFPKTVLQDISFARDLLQKQYCHWVSDGDLAMLTNMREGMGGGRTAVNRSGIPTPIAGCAFHKLVRIHKMVDGYLSAARHERRVMGRNQRQTKSELSYLSRAFNTVRLQRISERGDAWRPQPHDGGLLLDGKKDSTGLFGALLDECMNHDDEGVGLGAWYMFLSKLKLMGMHTCATHVQHYHHPQSGQQGSWARWNQLQEQAVPPFYTGEPNPPLVMHGACNTANPIEANMNKKLKIGTGMSLPLGALATAAQNIMTNMCRKMCPSFGFSLVPDQLGQCTETHHFKSSGAFGSDLTGNGCIFVANPRIIVSVISRFASNTHDHTDRKYEERFREGISKARGVRHLIFNHRLSGEGLTAHYLVGSDATVRALQNWNEYNKRIATQSQSVAKVKELRESWITFMYNPTEYVDFMLEVCTTHELE